ncbi:MAG: hypothetical protein HY549_04490 [Elusimicrobia bacterium]|nr:hypothetical protein [Elusimicrobiota bacterium]
MDIRNIPPPKPLPAFSMGSHQAFRLAACVFLTMAGMYYLGAGKKNQEPGKILLGGLLILAGLFVLF